MKRFLSLLLVLVLLSSFACAENPRAALADLTFEQLYLMIDVVNAEIVSRPEWKSTTVPAGDWIVGRDIPAGSYSISIIDGKTAYICVKGPATSLWETSFFFSQSMTSEEYNIGRIELKDGYSVHIEYHPVLFAPPVTLTF